MTNMNKFADPCVYILIGPGDEHFYVGSTKKNAQNRLWEHIYRARSGHSGPVYQRMRQLGIENIRAEVLVREANDELRELLEAAAIHNLIAEGHPLVNRLALDGIPNSHSDESRLALSKARSGKATWIKGKRGEAAGWTDERRRKQAELIRSRYQPDPR